MKCGHYNNVCPPELPAIAWGMCLIIIVLIFTISNIFTHTFVPGYVWNDHSISTNEMN